MEPTVTVSYQVIAWILGALLTLAGTGFFGILVKLWFDRRRQKALTDKTAAETDAIHISNDAHRLTALGITNSTIAGLLAESEANVAAMRKVNAELTTAKTENDELAQQNSNQKAIIGYQKDERHEWTQQLKLVITELAEARLEIQQLTRRVAELESQTNGHGDSDPLKVELVNPPE
jgi:predicted outer membrane lipoprotein